MPGKHPRQHQKNGTTETKSLATPSDVKGAADKSSSKTSSSSSSSSTTGKKSNTEILKAERDRIVGLSYKYGGTNTTVEVKSGTSKVNGKNKSWVTRTVNNAEIVDIVNDYPWILDSIVAKGSEYTFSAQVKGGDAAATRAAYNKKSKVPVCYISERKSVVNSSISNILSLISTINDVGQTLTSVSNSTSGMMSDIAAGGSSMINTFKDKVVSAIRDYLPGFAALLAQNNLNDEILNPYRFLYITADTGKRYVFPLTSKESSCFITSKNAWGEPKGGVPKALKAIFDTVNSFQTEIAGFTNLGKNIFSLAGTGENADDNGTVKEVAKTFTYPTKGDAINIQFTLYNTTRKNAWRDNFRFLYLFAVRNLPFRTEMMSFTPPLLYDIIVPGVKRLPICALSQMKVDPLGITRTLECDNFISGSGKIPVNVPEAWSIQLTFECLIAPSANLMLANTIGELNIDVASDLGEMFTEEEHDDAKKELDEMAKKLSEKCEAIGKSNRFDKARDEMKRAQLEGYSKRCKDHMQGALMKIVDGYQLWLHDDGSYSPPTNANTEDYPYKTVKQGGRIIVKQPFELNPNVYSKLARADAYTKTVLLAEGVTEAEINENPPSEATAKKISSALTPYIGKPGTANKRDGRTSTNNYIIYKPDGTKRYGKGWIENTNLSWGNSRSSFQEGTMTEDTFGKMEAALTASGINAATRKLWDAEINKAIKGNPEAYPTMQGGEFPYSADYADGKKTPEGYLDADARKKMQQEITAELEEYQKKVDEASKRGMDTSKLSNICQDTKPAAAEQPES